MDYSKEQLLDTLAQIAPNRYLQAFLIIVLFALVAKIVDIILTRFIRRLITKTKFTLDDQILDIFHKPIFVSIMLFGLVFIEHYDIFSCEYVYGFDLTNILFQFPDIDSFNFLFNEFFHANPPYSYNLIFHSSLQKNMFSPFLFLLKIMLHIDIHYFF